MRTIHAISLVAFGFAVAPMMAGADVASDRAAAILVFPTVEAVEQRFSDTDSNTRITSDTLIQLSNTSNQPVRAHCFYVSAVGQCSVSGFGCFDGSDCPEAVDICLPNWIETDFDVVLTPRQPLAWRASRGLSRELLPIDGFTRVGSDGSSNAGTLVPPVRLDPIAFDDETTIFIGELKCIAVDAAGRGIPANVLKGEATLEDQFEATEIGGPGIIHDVVASKYNGIGIQAIEGDANDDGVLELGGGSNEYNGCSEVLIAQHFFDLAVVNDEYLVASVLYLVPCTQNFRLQEPGSTTVQFLVFNEFEQRFSTSRRVDCYFASFLSNIDTSQEESSIWSAAVSGTLSGQTRIRGVQTGLLGVINEVSIEGRDASAASHLALQGDREQPDFIIISGDRPTL